MLAAAVACSLYAKNLGYVFQEALDLVGGALGPIIGYSTWGQYVWVNNAWVPPPDGLVRSPSPWNHRRQQERQDTL